MSVLVTIRMCSDRKYEELEIKPILDDALGGYCQKNYFSISNLISAKFRIGLSGHRFVKFFPRFDTLYIEFRLYK
jgi:hypothetical protein